MAFGRPNRKPKRSRKSPLQRGLTKAARKAKPKRLVNKTGNVRSGKTYTVRKNKKGQTLHTYSRGKGKKPLNVVVKKGKGKRSVAKQKRVPLGSRGGGRWTK